MDSNNNGVNPLYGLAEIDPGDWGRGSDPKKERYLDNSKTEFRVYYQHIHPRFSEYTRYVVCKNGFCMGFSFKPTRETLIHVDDPMNKTPRVVIENMGGRYITNKIYGDTPTTSRHTELSHATHFNTMAQQQEFIAALKDAVPRIPVVGCHLSRWNGGFGYQVDFTKELLKKLEDGAFIDHGTN